eukprot:s5873_g2.t1
MFLVPDRKGRSLRAVRECLAKMLTQVTQGAAIPYPQHPSPIFPRARFWGPSGREPSAIGHLVVHLRPLTVARHVHGSTKQPDGLRGRRVANSHVPEQASAEVELCWKKPWQWHQTKDAWAWHLWPSDVPVLQDQAALLRIRLLGSRQGWHGFGLARTWCLWGQRILRLKAPPFCRPCVRQSCAWARVWKGHARPRILCAKRKLDEAAVPATHLHTPKRRGRLGTPKVLHYTWPGYLWPWWCGWCGLGESSVKIRTEMGVWHFRPRRPSKRRESGTWPIRPPLPSRRTEVFDSMPQRVGLLRALSHARSGCLWWDVHPVRLLRRAVIWLTSTASHLSLQSAVQVKSARCSSFHFVQS